MFMLTEIRKTDIIDHYSSLPFNGKWRFSIKKNLIVYNSFQKKSILILVEEFYVVLKDDSDGTSRMFSPIWTFV